MAEKSPRRRMLEERLAEDPADTFLRYGLALQCLRDGDLDEGRRRLGELIAEGAEDVASCHQLGQSYLETSENEQAIATLREGISRALARGNSHAAEEMRALLPPFD